jgi:glycosyltransferase involved in cell wall biosynthesis
LKKIIYIDNFLSKHGSPPTIGELITDSLQKEGYNIIRSSNVKNKVFRLIDMLFTIGIKRKKSVVLIATYSTSAFYFAYASCILCRILQNQYIPCLHGGNLPERIKRNPNLCEQMFKHSFTNIVVSEYLQKCMVDKGWSFTLIQNPIEVKNYDYRERYNTKPNLLWVRSFHRLYNPQMAIIILRQLKEKFPSAKLTMVGPDRDGSLHDCIELSKKWALEESIHFLGLLSKEEWIKLAETHDYFINTTNFDNLPVSVIEAMALGMVVVSTNVGGMKYLIKDNLNGVLLEANKPRKFVDSIEHLLIHKEDSEKLSKNARTTAENYDWQNIKNKWDYLLENIN